MNRLIFSVILCICSVTCFSQKIIINGKAGNRPLKWEDFKGKPDNNSSFFANTYWQIGYKFNSVQFRSDTADLKGLELVLDFVGSKSWLKKNKGTEYLLNHEQKHFDIAVICLMEITRLIQNTVFLKQDLNSTLNALFTTTLDRYKDLEKKYDNETKHSMNTEQQEKWNQFISDELIRHTNQKTGN